MTKIREVKEKIILPEGVNATLENEILVIKGEKGNSVLHWSLFNLYGLGKDRAS